MRNTLLFVTALLFLVKCDNDPTNSPTVVNTEVWKIVDAEDPLSKADLTFNSLSNSTVSAGGKWVYLFYGDTVTCTFLTGNAAVNDTSVSINVKGTASYPPKEKQEEPGRYLLQKKTGRIGELTVRLQAQCSRVVELQSIKL